LAVRAGLEKAAVNAIEEPLRRGDLRGTARMRKRTSIPIILDESIFTPEQALEAIRWNACDFISIYPGKNGGLRRSLHVAAAVSNLATSIGHEIIGPLYHTRVLDPEMPIIKEGHVALPCGAGLGVNVDFEPLQKHQHPATHVGSLCIIGAGAGPH
jgi:L-alanine-DL-glutamate epimerase-like enolase superfamily enzyme